MKLTEKDRTFLETLKKLMESKDLWVELRPDRLSHMVLKGAYCEKVHEAFRMTRQGVRWRFHRLFNNVYVSAFETILFIERIFGSELREHAIRISKERYELRQRVELEGIHTPGEPRRSDAPDKQGWYNPRESSKEQAVSGPNTRGER